MQQRWTQLPNLQDLPGRRALLPRIPPPRELEEARDVQLRTEGQRPVPVRGRCCLISWSNIEHLDLSSGSTPALSVTAEEMRSEVQSFPGIFIQIQENLYTR
ncbi:hypothetical protein GN956_G5492 [Arapaima gigas]